MLYMYNTTLLVYVSCRVLYTYWCNMLSSCDVWPLIFAKRRTEFVNSSLSWENYGDLFSNFSLFYVFFFHMLWGNNHCYYVSPLVLLYCPPLRVVQYFVPCYWGHPKCCPQPQYVIFQLGVEKGKLLAK